MANALLLINVVTDLHNGAGQGLGQIDRPIIRERKTGFPYVQAETIKGNFRAEMLLRSLGQNGAGPNRAQVEKKRNVLFGDDDAGGSKHRGFLEFTDANLLALPVRSLRGGFVWATTPLLLARLERCWKLVDPSFSEAAAVLDLPLEEGVLLAPTGAGQQLQYGQHAFLEEFAFTCQEEGKMSGLAGALAQRLWKTGSWWANKFQRAFVVLHPDAFRHFVLHATEIKANIGMTSEGPNTGTTTGGSLRYTEYLPQESLLFCLVEAEQPPKELAEPLEGRSSLQQLDDLVKKQETTLFQLGADETKGKGLVEFRLLMEGNS